MLRRLIQTGGPVLILIFFTLWGEYLWFGDIVLHPNRYVFVFNADGKQICFNFMYHLKYGHGFTLSNQNYPFYEFICMTDAQAAVSVICHFIQEHIMNIEPWAMGIFNGFILYTLPFCSLFLYGIFRELAMGRLFSVVFALLICFLSQQMLRLTNGHYGLAYLFVIPAIYFFLLKMVRSGHAGFYFLMVIGTGMCIGINNGHLALAAGIQILSFALVYLFLFRTDSGYKKWLPLLSFIVLMSFFFFFIHSMDSASDRELHPWGFFTFYSQLSSYFLPTYGFFYNKLHSFFPASAFEIEGEGTAYLGTLALLLPVFILLRIAFRTIRYHSLRWPYRNNMVLVFLISLLPVMLYSMALPFRWGLESWVYRIPFLGQFRVPGRFSWIVYYAFGIVLGYTLYILIRWLRRKHRVFPFLLWIPILLFYGTDIVSASRFVMRFSSGENHFPSNPFLEKQEWKKDLQQHAIDTQHVQCILGLPVFNAWSSKFGIDTDPDSLVTRMVMISTETGLPWMNAKLSRIAVSPLMQSTQMGSHPVIVKEILQHLPSRKKIVLIHLNSYSPTESEQALIAKAQLIFRDASFSYFEFDPSVSWNSYRDSIRQLAHTLTPAYHTQEQELRRRGLLIEAFIQKPVQTHPENVICILDTFCINTADSLQMECSLWNTIDYHLDDAPWMRVQVLDLHDSICFEKDQWSARGRDIQHGQMRTEIPFQLNKGRYRVQVFLLPGDHHVLHSFLLRPADFNYFNRRSERLYYNNYQVDE